jgi:hypothetical protein
MGRLQRLEQRIEAAVTRTFSRMFRSEVEPVELASAITRVMEQQKAVISRERAIAPNEFTVALSPRDHARLAAYQDSLTNQLRQLAEEHAQLQRLSFPGDVRISLSEDESLTTGEFRVVGAARAGVTTAAHAQAPPDAAAPRGPGWLQIGEEIVRIPPAGLLLGRGSDCDIRVDDPGVSRRHAEIRVVGHGSDADLVAVDLGSMNGTFVDDQRVQQSILGEGSRLRVGSTDVVVHRGEPPPSAQRGAAGRGG